MPLLIHHFNEMQNKSSSNLSLTNRQISYTFSLQVEGLLKNLKRGISMKIIRMLVASAALCCFAVPVDAMLLRSGKICNQKTRRTVEYRLDAIMGKLNFFDTWTIVPSQKELDQFGQWLNIIDERNRNENLILDDKINEAFRLYNKLVVLAQTPIDYGFGTLTEEEALEAFGPIPFPELNRADTTTPVLAEPSDQPASAFVPAKRRLHRSNAESGDQLLNSVSSTPSPTGTKK